MALNFKHQTLVDCIHYVIAFFGNFKTQVHAYVAAPNGKSAYLSELASGSEALVINPYGRQRLAIVGRTKIETRPLVRIGFAMQ